MDNKVADALSRYPHDNSASVLAISAVVPSWVEEVIQGYKLDEHSQTLITQLLIDPVAVPGYSLRMGFFGFAIVWLGSNTALHQKVIAAMHNSAIGGHSGVPVTLGRLKQYFAWPSMKKSVQEFVANCSVCSQAKPDRAKYPRLLQPVQVPSSAWQTISMDFVEGFPTSQSSNCSLVVVDKFTKYGHVIPLKHPFTALSVAKLFMARIYKLHGLPNAIISDRGRIFLSHLWQELFHLVGVQLCMSSAYHPQSDGQTERVNQCMETFLRCFVHACPSQWSHWISLAEYWYNTSLHSALGRSPFEPLYGYTPCCFGLDAVAVPLSLELVPGFRTDRSWTCLFASIFFAPRAE